jgi:3-oxoacyl-[acyl-carrier-protein] synthase III
MATNFPGGIDTFVNPNATSSLDSPSHAGLHTDLADGMTAVQTQLVNNPYGLIHIETQVFTNVSSVSFSNNVFSSTYDNYKLIATKTAGSTTNSMAFRLRVGGTDEAGSNYNRQFLSAGSTTVSGAVNTAQNIINFMGAQADRQSATLEIFLPFAAQRTQIITFANQTGTNPIFITNSEHTGNTSFDSCSILANTGNITGTISIYGYRK